MKTWQSKSGVVVLLVLLALVGPLASLTGWHLSQQGPGSAAVAGLAYAHYLLVAISAVGVALAVVLYFVLAGKVFRPLGEVYSQFEDIASGNLVSKAGAVPGAGPLSDVLLRLQKTIGQSIGGVRNGMHHINNEALTIQQGNRDLSERLNQQITALHQTVSSMEQLAGTVSQNADNAHQANQLAVTASEVAHRGGVAVGEVVSTMHEISASSQKISDIVGVIDSIAFQTNILALNAAVEAARAGEQGKGFAVVASEVRALAQRSAHAAREIKDLIDDSVKRVAEGSGQVERAGATMEEIVGSVARVTDIMGEISAATIEQTTGIEDVKQVMSRMDAMTQDNARLLDDNANAAAQLIDHIQAVSRSVASFRVSSRAAGASPKKAVPVRGLVGSQQADNARASLAAPKRHALAAAGGTGSSQAQRQGEQKQRQLAGHGATAAAASALATASTDTTAGPLLRPQISAQSVQYQSSEDEWEEF